MEDGFGKKEAFQGIKGCLAGRGPRPGQVFLGEVDQRAGDVGVVRNELSVEVGEAEEGAYILDLDWSRPVCNAIEFNRVHG